MKRVGLFGNFQIHALAVMLVFLGFCNLAKSAGLSVTITPSTDQVVAKDDAVVFSCTASGGCAPYTYSWTFSNGEPAASTSQNPGNVTFGSSAEGKENAVSVTVTDAKSNTATQSVKVIVPKLTVDGPSDLWWFQGFHPKNYATSIKLKISPTISVNSFSWTIEAGDTIVSVNDGASANTETPFVTVKSILYSLDYQDVNIQTQFSGSNGPITLNYTTEVRTTNRCVSSLISDESYTDSTSSDYVTLHGYKTTYRMTIFDQFDNAIPKQLEVNEYLDESHNDYGAFNNWNESQPSGSATFANAPAQFPDLYIATGGPFSVPTVVSPSDENAGVAVKHCDQRYYTGSQTPGQGVWIRSHVLQLYRGYGRQEHIQE